jgi:hypothetical protein
VSLAITEVLDDVERRRPVRYDYDLFFGLTPNLVQQTIEKRELAYNGNASDTVCGIFRSLVPARSPATHR